MNILVIGATGTIGNAIVNACREAGHDVVGAHRSGRVSVDLEAAQTVTAALEAHGPFHAIICAAGEGAFGPVQQLDDAAYESTIASKLMGQVNLIRAAHEEVETIVVTTGILAQHPWPGSSVLAMANGGLESFVRAAALDLERNRVVAVSPPLVRETAIAMGMGERGPTAAEVAEVYVAALEAESGQILQVAGH